MKHETIFIIVRVLVQSTNTSLKDILTEIDTQSKVSLTDTANINILETEILSYRAPNPKNINYGTRSEL
jgi:hypothetical protein